MEFKLLKFIDRYESKCTDADGKVWHEAVWGIDLEPSDIRREALLLAEEIKAKETIQPEEIIIPVDKR